MLEREKTSLETARKEKEDLEKTVKELTEYNQGRSTPLPSRREPSGISDSISNMSIAQLVEERNSIEKRLRDEKEKQKFIKERLIELKRASNTVSESMVCVLQ